jgi:hypothetical protein
LRRVDGDFEQARLSVVHALYKRKLATVKTAFMCLRLALRARLRIVAAELLKALAVSTVSEMIN